MLEVATMVEDPDSAPSADSPLMRVFISYSRKDMDFVDGLAAALKQRRIEAFIDRQDIADLEKWKPRIHSLILKADTVMVVISPDAVKPKSFRLKEVDIASSLKKRFAPIVYCHLESAKQAPEILGEDHQCQFKKFLVFGTCKMPTTIEG